MISLNKTSAIMNGLQCREMYLYLIEHEMKKSNSIKKTSFSCLFNFLNATSSFEMCLEFICD